MGAASPAFAAGPSWLEPATLSSGAATPPAVALAAPGDAAALWTRAGAVESRVRAPQASYGAATPLANQGSAPDVDVAPDGTAVAAWAQDQAVLYAVRAPGGSFGTPLQLGADGGSGSVTAVRVVVNGAGDALISYLRGRAYAAVRVAGSAAGETSAISTGPACDLDAAAGLNGQGAIVFRDCGNGATPVRVARRTGTGFATTDVGSGTAPAVAVDTDGTTVAAWESAGAIRAAAAPQGAAFGTARTISEGVAGQPALAATTDGIWAAWRVGANPRVVAARRPTGQDFVAGETISPEGVGAEGPVLAGGGDGSVVAAWVRSADSASRVEFARRGPGSARFAPSGLVSAAAAESAGLDLDVDGDGNALAGYLRGGVATVQTLDAAGPRFVGVDIREAGHALDVYPFAVDLADAWSGVASSAFDFGDGTSAPGPRAEHAFAAQGERTVTVSATDALGNVSTLARRFVTGPPLDRTAPVITGAKLDATRFRRTTKETAVIAKSRRRRGTRFRYTLSEPAQATIFFERVLMGRRRGKVCVRGNRRGKRCRVYEPVGLITRNHPIAGRVSAAFTGRIVGRSGPLKVVDVFFKPRRDRATIVAADATRNISKPVQLAFTVLR